MELIERTSRFSYPKRGDFPEGAYPKLLIKEEMLNSMIYYDNSNNSNNSNNIFIQLDSVIISYNFFIF